MLHKTDHNKKRCETWYCKNHECKSSVKLTVSTIKTEVVKLLNEVICNPLIFEKDEQIQSDFSMDICRLENEINRMLEQLDFDKQILKNLIFECAAKKYDEDISTRHIIDRLKADFVKSSLLSKFSVEFFQRTVSQILLTKNETICIRLKNNIVIGREFDNNEHKDHCHAEGC